MKPTAKRSIELLAPARDASIAIAAIDHGADAVYMGATQWGARAQAGNSVADVARVCDYAHQFGARIYVTVNTLVYDDELRDVERLIGQLWHAGADALIVQDMGLLRLDLPPIALHASTQCDLRTPAKARFLQDMGFSQLVMARELTLQEIKAIHQAVNVPLEAFCHGALCVCYSGRCQASQALKQRSANRGECAQMCRLSYDLEDENEKKILSAKHLLSLRDMNRSDMLKPMIDAGVSSFKIEGRLKDVGYVKNVVAYYRQALDRIIAQQPGELHRASSGTSSYTFTPSLAKSFNRSFTHYFLDERYPKAPMASFDTPKSMGEYLGKVKSVRGKNLVIDTRQPIANGDGLSYMGGDGNFTGIRVNLAEGNRVTLRTPVDIAVGTKVYRTFDKAMNDLLAGPSASRTIALDATLRRVDGGLALTLADERGNRVTHTMPLDDAQEAQSPQGSRQRDTIAKLGNTIYRLEHAEVLDDLFIPASLLTQLRRDTIALLDRANTIAYQRPRRRAEQAEASYPTDTLTSADNVANHLAEQLYREHGVEHIEPALEVGGTAHAVMHTRYCLRRELGACLKGPRASALPRRLYLRYGTTRLQVQCHCDTCEMTLHLT